MYKVNIYITIFYVNLHTYFYKFVKNIYKGGEFKYIYYRQWYIVEESGGFENVYGRISS